MTMPKKVQAKDITDEQFLAVVDRVCAEKKRWTHLEDLEVALGPGISERPIRAKAKSLIKRRLITGCACGCRGDFERIRPKEEKG